MPKSATWAVSRRGNTSLGLWFLCKWGPQPSIFSCWANPHTRPKAWINGNVAITPHNQAPGNWTLPGRGSDACAHPLWSWPAGPRAGWAPSASAGHPAGCPGWDWPGRAERAGWRHLRREKKSSAIIPSLTKSFPFVSQHLSSSSQSPPMHSTQNTAIDLPEVWIYPLNLAVISSTVNVF